MIKSFVKSTKNSAKKIICKMDSSLILMFHHVTDSPSFLKSKCVLDTNNFLKVIDEFDEYISCNSLVVSHKHKSLKGKVAVTFDDGLEDVYTIAYPILIDKKIPFTIFVISDFLDTEGYISKAQLIEMSKNPLVTVGAHGLSHDILTQLSNNQKWDEINGSKIKLENIIGEKISFFAYSHGKYDNICKKMVKKAGYSAAFSTRWLPVNRFTLKLITEIPRYNVINDNMDKIGKLKIEILHLKE